MLRATSLPEVRFVVFLHLPKSSRAASSTRLLGRSPVDIVRQEQRTGLKKSNCSASATGGLKRSPSRREGSTDQRVGTAGKSRGSRKYRGLVAWI